MRYQLFVILPVTLALLAGPALAQQRRAVPATNEPSPAAALPRPPLCDPLNLIPGCRNPDGSVNQKPGGNPFDNLTDDLLPQILAAVTYREAGRGGGAAGGGNRRPQDRDQEARRRADRAGGAGKSSRHAREVDRRTAPRPGLADRPERIERRQKRRAAREERPN